MGPTKYIVYDDFNVGVTIIIFPSFLVHQDVATRMRAHVLSAGFLSIGADGSPHCYGESVSLNVKANPATDNVLAARLLGR